MFAPGVPFLKGSAKNSKPPSGINVINSHHALALRSCIRRTIKEKIDGINIIALNHIIIVKKTTILIDNLYII